MLTWAPVACSHLAKSMKRPDDVAWNRLASQPTNKQKKLAELKNQVRSFFKTEERSFVLNPACLASKLCLESSDIHKMLWQDPRSSEGAITTLEVCNVEESKYCLSEWPLYTRVVVLVRTPSICSC